MLHWPKAKISWGWGTVLLLHGIPYDCKQGFHQDGCWGFLMDLPVLSLNFQMWRRWIVWILFAKRSRLCQKKTTKCSVY